MGLRPLPNILAGETEMENLNAVLRRIDEANDIRIAGIVVDLHTVMFMAPYGEYRDWLEVN